MKIKLVVFILLLSQMSFGMLSAKYKITSAGVHLGDMTVVQSEENGIVNVKIISDVKVKLFLTINLKYRLNCVYKNNVLTYSSVTTYVNGDKHSTLITEKKDNSYTITEDGHTTKYTKLIQYSGGLLYFQAPNSRKTLYSEFNGYNKQIKKMNDNLYEVMDNTTGHKSTYQYNKQGYLEKATVEHTLMTFTMTKY